jgi:hypothetical protein
MCVLITSRQISCGISPHPQPFSLGEKRAGSQSPSYFGRGPRVKTEGEDQRYVIYLPVTYLTFCLIFYNKLPADVVAQATCCVWSGLPEVKAEVGATRTIDWLAGLCLRLTTRAL